MDEHRFQDVVRRVERLERAVFSSTGKSKIATRVTQDHRGATGGIRLLMDEGFFKEKRKFGDICSAASARGYHYSKQAFQDALSRLSSKEKVLVALSEKGRKLYAIRK